MKRNNILIVTLFTMLMSFSCTDLNEDFQGDLKASQVKTATTAQTSALLTSVYNSACLYFQTTTGGLCAFNVLTTDEMMAPTRGADWDDNGNWRVLHQHKWDGSHTRLRDLFNNLCGTIFSATDFLQYGPTAQQEAEARLIRAWAMYWMLDLFDQVPYREPGESVLQPSKVRKGMEALNYIISEINTVSANLPTGPAGLANKDAAKVFLMKIYLNKGVYANRATPTFDVADMNKVVSLADEIINTNKYAFTSNYFDNFAPNNTVIGKENIWTQENVGGKGSNYKFRYRWITFMHYNQNPVGSNGWVLLSDFYNKFEANDKRKGCAYKSAGSPANPGNRINVGFLIGQQYNLATDAPLKDRGGNLLIFTPEVKLIETGTNLEVTGIRPVKYFPDYVNDASNLVDNDYVYFRLADVLLMKAEAILRGGTATASGAFGNTALDLVNSIRTHESRGASALSSLNLDVLLDERGRELYQEGWRRQDLIRFGKFLQPWFEKPQSDPKYLIFPISDQQLAVNPNLVQNPGY